MKGVAELYTDIEVGAEKSIGVATIRKFHLTKERAQADNMAMMMSYTPGFYRVDEGTYMILEIGYGTMMSDTPMEKRTNNYFIQRANGKVMIAGLGIGLLLHNLRDKIASGKITEVVVYEKYQEVIDLISPYFKDLPIIYRCEDILEYKPGKDEIYDSIYFDIWEAICGDNLEEMSFLHRRWGRKINRSNPAHYMDSWMKDYLTKEKRKYG